MWRVMVHFLYVLPSGEPLVIFHVALKNNHVQSVIHHTGFFKKKQPSTKKFQHAPEAPGLPVSMLLLITSQWLDTTLRLGNQGCLTVLARIQVGWLFFLKNPVFHHQVSTMRRWAKFIHFP